MSIQYAKPRYGPLFFLLDVSTALKGTHNYIFISLFFVFRFFAFGFSFFVFRFSTFELGPDIAFWHSKSYFDIRSGARISQFWHSKSYFDIRIRAEYRILTFKILFWHSNSGRISHFDIQNPILTFEMGAEYRIFDIQNPILTFEMGPNIAFWHSKSNFDIRIWAVYRILTFKILFWHLKWSRITHFDIRNPIFTFEFGRNIAFWHSNSYFDIRIRAEYRILTFEILLWHSKWGRISNFDIQNPILTFEMGPNIEFWHSKSYFDIRTGAEYRILTFKILSWHLKWSRNIAFLTFEILFLHSNLGGPNILFWRSKSYYDIRNGAEYRIFDIHNPILTFEMGPNIEFRHSKSYFDIRTGAEYRILTFEILFWQSKSGGISYFDIQNLILTIEMGPKIAFWHSKSYFDIRTGAEYRILTF